MAEREIDIHHHEYKLEEQKKYIVKQNEISPRNKELIFEFEKALRRQSLSTSRILKYMVMLGMIARKLRKDFDKATKEDIEDFVLNEIEYGKSYLEFKRNKPYTEWTKKTYKIFLKRFYQWLYIKYFNCPEGTYPPIVSWFKTTIPRNKLRNPHPSEMVTEEDVQKLIAVCDHRRDKAIIALLAESGVRISELGGLRIKDVVFDEVGAIIRVIGKVGERVVRIIASVPYLKEWLLVHKFRDDPDAPLWLKLYNKGIKKSGGDYMQTEEVRQIAKMPMPIPPIYSTYRSLLIRTFIRAGFDSRTKRFNPHGFRHARACSLAGKISPYEMDSYFGWQVGGKMASHYIHLSGKSLDIPLQKLNGIPVSADAMQSKLRPKICPRCHTMNEFEREFCKNVGCHAPLTLQVAINVEEELKQRTIEAERSNSMLKAMLEVPEIKEVLVRHLGLK